MTIALRGRFRLDDRPPAAPPSAPTGPAELRDERLTVDVDAGLLRVRWLRDGPRFVLLLGEGPQGVAQNGALETILAGLDRDAPTALARLRDPFVLFFSDAQSRRCLLATDRAGIRSPCHALASGTFAFGLSATDVEAALGGSSALRLQSVYEYLYFHVIPSPATIFEGIERLPPGHLVEATPRGRTVASYWTPHYGDARQAPRFETARAELREHLRTAVASAVDPGTTGTFLSGGTDSSTVAGVLAEQSKEPVATYSIGFDVAGFDEMAYARIAAARFGTRHRIRYLTPADLLASVPAIAGSYDQPFGNSSAAAAYLCTQTAAGDGITTLLGGDGGDEIFGGNTRYAKQRVFDVYGRVPAALRTSVVEPLFLGVPALRRVPLLRKVSSYVEQARVPMPDRLETYNLLDRVGVSTMLAPAVLAEVDTGAPARAQRAWYARCADPALVNRMLHFDWKYTLADNDLPKVVGTADLAGVRTAFPLLDPDVVAFANGLPADWKVRGARLRWFFKRALDDFLPPEIIRKRKHGFGLPFGAWVVSDPALQALARGALESLRDRGLLQRDFVDELMRPRLAEHATFYGELVWILMTLELWLAARRPSQRFG
jgi:asparagine synthase (glutamine-hydrolysing)